MTDTLDAIKEARLSGRYGDAVQLIAKAAAERNGQVSSLLGDQYGLILMAQKQWGDALNLYTLLLKQCEANGFGPQPNIWRNIAECCEGMRQYTDAKEAYRQAIDCSQGHEDESRFYIGYGSNVYRTGGDGEPWYREALTRKCTTPEATMQRGYLKLTLGQYGWQDIESRRMLKGFRDSVHVHTGGLELPPAWDGESKGTILVYGDQGAGDAIFFARYLSRLRNPYHLVVGRPLRKLLDGWDSPPRCDVSAPLTSLPFLTGTLDPIPPHCPKPWVKPKNAKPRVGVCWYGSSDYANDHDRSSPIDPRPLLTSYKWDLHSLQQGVDFHSPDYAWNANYLRLLDVVVTVDTSVAHLAGTLGVPTVLLAQTQPFWVWGLKAGSTPYYPSVRIVHRPSANEWVEGWAAAKATIREML
jgi:hypothetical protein